MRRVRRDLLPGQLIRAGLVLAAVASAGTTAAAGRSPHAPAPDRTVDVGYVTALAPTPTGVWLVESRKGVVTRVLELDPKSLRTTWQTPSARAVVLAATPATVWVGSRPRDYGSYEGLGRVISINAHSRARGRVLARIDPQHATTTGSSAVMAAPRVVARLARNRVIWERRIPVGLADAVATQGRTILVAAESESRANGTVLYKLDAATGKILSRTTLNVAVGAIATMNRAVWLLSGSTLYIVRHWAARPQVLLRRRGLSSMAAQGRTLWVGAEDGRLYRFDATGAFRGSFPITTTINLIASDGNTGNLWVVDNTSGKLISVRAR